MKNLVLTPVLALLFLSPGCHWSEAVKDYTTHEKLDHLSEAIGKLAVSLPGAMAGSPPAAATAAYSLVKILGWTSGFLSTAVIGTAGVVHVVRKKRTKRAPKTA